MTIINEIIAGSIAVILSGLFFRLISALNKQQKLAALLIALNNECLYNSRYRGDSQNIFQTYWLKKVLSNFQFYIQCESLSHSCLDLFELAKETNLNQIGRRKHENGVSLVIGDVQDKFIDTMVILKQEIPRIQQRTTAIGYLRYYMNKNTSMFLIKNRTNTH